MIYSPVTIINQFNIAIQIAIGNGIQQSIGQSNALINKGRLGRGRFWR